MDRLSVLCYRRKKTDWHTEEGQFFDTEQPKLREDTVQILSPPGKNSYVQCVDIANLALSSLKLKFFSRYLQV